MQISRPRGSYDSASSRDSTTISGDRVGVAFSSDFAPLFPLSPPRIPRTLFRFRRRPGSDQLAYGNDLADVIRRVIDSHQNGS